jgi:3-oxoadipate enol-lactonase
MPTVTAKDGIRINFEVHDYTDSWKNAPFLILQHGYGRSARFWYNMIPYLSRWYKVICPDLRGLGKSSRDFDLAKGLSVENYIDDILAVMDSLGAGDFHYGAESIGGVIGYVLAAKHPHRVRTLSVISSPVTISKWTQQAFAFEHPTWQDALRAMGTREWASAANGATRFPPDADKGLLDWYADEMGKSEVEVMVAMSHLASRVDASPYLSEIKAPVLGLYPSGGRVTTDDQLSVLRQNVKNLKIVHFPGWYHMVQTLYPAASAGQILNFISLHDGRVCHE